MKSIPTQKLKTRGKIVLQKLIQKYKAEWTNRRKNQKVGKLPKLILQYLAPTRKEELLVSKSSLVLLRRGREEKGREE